MDLTDKLLLGLMAVQGFVVIWRLWRQPTLTLSVRSPEPLPFQDELLQEEPFLPPVAPSADVPYARPADEDCWWKRGEQPPWEVE